MDQIIEKIFSEYGLIAMLFAFIVYSVVKWIPKLIEKHFEAVDKMQDKFSKSLNITTDKFVNQLDGMNKNISEEHERQNQILDKILEKIAK